MCTLPVQEIERKENGKEMIYLFVLKITRDPRLLLGKTRSKCGLSSF